MHLAVMEDLLNHCRDIRTFDFLYGDDLLKRRLSNQSREERHFYLFPRHTRGIVSYGSLRVVNSISERLGGLFRAMKMSEQVKQWLRRRAER
jgi:CelD/BcsL family acetyltransferase involved in cellulose biosynthesis